MRLTRGTLVLVLCLTAAACKSGGPHGATDGAAGASSGAAGNPGTAGVAATAGGAGTVGGAGAAGTAGAGVAGGAGSMAGAGAAGAGGVAGATGAAGQACGPPARTYDFAHEQWRTLGMYEALSALYIRPDGVPTVVYLNNYNNLEVLTPPVLGDAGVTVSVATLLAKNKPHFTPVARVGKNGDLHVVFLDYFANARVRHLQWNGDMSQLPLADEIANFDAGHIVGLFGLDLDSQDQPAVAYALDDEMTIRYSAKTAGVWQAETVGTLSSALAPVVAFDGAGAPVVLGDNGTLQFATRGANGWSPFAAVDPQNLGSAQPWAGRDAAGNVEAFYLATDQYRRAVLQGGTWNLKVPTPGTGLNLLSSNGRPTVVMGPKGQIHAVFEGGGAVVYSYFDGCTQWMGQTVDDTDGAMSPRMAIDAAGNPHFAVLHPMANDPLTKLPMGYELWYVHPKP